MCRLESRYQHRARTYVYTRGHPPQSSTRKATASLLFKPITIISFSRCRRLNSRSHDTHDTHPFLCLRLPSRSWLTEEGKGDYSPEQGGSDYRRGNRSPYHSPLYESKRRGPKRLRKGNKGAALRCHFSQSRWFAGGGVGCDRRRPRKGGLVCTVSYVTS